MELFTIAIFSGIPIFSGSPPKAFNCIRALEHKFDMCWSKDPILLLSIASLYLASLSFLFKIIALNLSALTIISLCLNQLTADSSSCFKVFKSSIKVLQVVVMVLSSAKLCKSNFLMHKNKSFIEK